MLFYPRSDESTVLTAFLGGRLSTLKIAQNKDCWGEDLWRKKIGFWFLFSDLLTQTLREIDDEVLPPHLPWETLVAVLHTVNYYGIAVVANAGDFQGLPMAAMFLFPE